MTDSFDAVDPFIGTEPCDPSRLKGLASRWLYLKAQIGNTHPGPVRPFSRMSACPYSGGYPTGYGRFDVNTFGVPRTLFDDRRVYGVTHLHQSGTGFIDTFYNFLLTVPLPPRRRPAVPAIPLSDSRPFALRDERAVPGYYAARIPEHGIDFELTTDAFRAFHRYHGVGSIVLDVTNAGLYPERCAARPKHVVVEAGDDGAVSGEFNHYGVWWYYACVAYPEGTFSPAGGTAGTPMSGGSLEISAPDVDGRVRSASDDGISHDGGPPVLWVGGRAPGENGYIDVSPAAGRRIALTADECTGDRAGAYWMLPPDRPAVFTAVLSLESVQAARVQLRQTLDIGFDRVREDSAEAWRSVLDGVRVEGGTEADRRKLFTGLYHACLAPSVNESTNHLWHDGPALHAGFATLWDQYKTQLPLVYTLFPERIEPVIDSFFSLHETIDRLPPALLFDDNPERFTNQSRGLPVLAMADGLEHLRARDDGYLRRERRRFDRFVRTSITELRRHAAEMRRLGPEAPQYHAHLLDLAAAAGAVRLFSRAAGRDAEVSPELHRMAEGVSDAVDADTGLLRRGTYYEGGRHHYSFRFVHGMSARVSAAGGRERYRNLLDGFFGIDADPVSQLQGDETRDEYARAIGLGRFDGCNNEVCLDAPYSYAAVGATERLETVLAAVRDHHFTDEAGGLPGNDDSGGLSSWLVWSMIGLFPLPGQSCFVRTRPCFERVTVRSGDTEVVIPPVDEPHGGLERPFVAYKTLYAS